MSAMTPIQKQVRHWLEEERVDIFLAYRIVEGHSLPHAFTRERIEETAELVTGPARYSLEKFATHIAARHPDARIGMVARDCNQRALNVLQAWNQLKPGQVETVPVNCCPSLLKPHADCSYLEPEPAGHVKLQRGLDPNQSLAQADALPQEERFDRWMYEFSKCIKCYGCRNICPVCFCKECSLEHAELIGTGHLPPDIPIFHLVRAVHMAGRCIDCGLCEDACPAEIPLRLLYRKVNAIVKDLFDYETGSGDTLPPFSILGDKPTMSPMPLMAVSQE
jgi:ferredoxin